MRTSDELLAELKALHPRRIDLSLGRIEALLAKLGNPQHRLPPVIHIAGTNGKGSTAALLKAMLQAAGKRVHVYTSPHLVRFHERIELAGADGQGAADRREPSWSSCWSALGASTPATPSRSSRSRRRPPSWPSPSIRPTRVILEVGLGGRLDATNVVARPALTVITPVSHGPCRQAGRQHRPDRAREGRHPQARRARR